MESISVKVAYKGKNIIIGKGIQSEEAIMDELQKRFPEVAHIRNFMNMEYEEGTASLAQAYQCAKKADKKSIKVKVFQDKNFDRTLKFEITQQEFEKENPMSLSVNEENTHNKITQQQKQTSEQIKLQSNPTSGSAVNNKQQQINLVDEQLLKQEIHEELSNTKEEKPSNIVAREFISVEPNQREPQLFNNEKVRELQKDINLAQENLAYKIEPSQLQSKEILPPTKQTDQKSKAEGQVLEYNASFQKQTQNNLKKQSQIKQQVEYMQQDKKNQPSENNDFLIDLLNKINEDESPLIQNEHSRILSNILSQKPIDSSQKQIAVEQKNTVDKQQNKSVSSSKSSSLKIKGIDYEEQQQIKDSCSKCKQFFKAELLAVQKDFAQKIRQMQGRYNDLNQKFNQIQKNYQWLVESVKTGEINPKLSQKEQKPNKYYEDTLGDAGNKKDPFNQQGIDVEIIENQQQFIKVNEKYIPKFTFTNIGYKKWPQNVFAMQKSTGYCVQVKSLEPKEKIQITLGEEIGKREGEQIKRMYQLIFYNPKGEMKTFGRTFALFLKVQNSANKPKFLFPKNSHENFQQQIRKILSTNKITHSPKHIIEKLKQMEITEQNFSDFDMGTILDCIRGF